MDQMTTDQQAEEQRQAKTATRQMWALGDYHAFATATVWQLGPALVEACGIGPDHRVLDVAAGSGNTALRAAERGARVVASDLTPENFEAGRREAAARGLALVWAEADAEHLPFADGEFDVVTSSFGAMFAPDHQAAAGEMLRVCRPGGTIGMLNFRPEGLAAEFFGTLARHAPAPPPGARSPLLWGSEEHVRGLFGNAVDSLTMTRGSYRERSPGGPGAYRSLFASTFGPVIAIRAGLDADQAAAFDDDLLEFTTRHNHGVAGGAAEYPYDYLLVVARTRADARSRPRPGKAV